MQRRALGLLFAVLALALAGVAAAAAIGAGGEAGRWIVAAASLAVAGWLGSLALAALRRH